MLYEIRGHKCTCENDSKGHEEHMKNILCHEEQHKDHHDYKDKKHEHHTKSDAISVHVKRIIKVMKNIMRNITVIMKNTIKIIMIIWIKNMNTIWN